VVGSNRLNALKLTALLLACMASWSSHADTLEKIRTTGQVYLGYRSAAVPFSFSNSAGAPQGYAVDICLHLANTIKTTLKLPDLKLNWIPTGQNEKTSALSDGMIDIDCADSTVTHASQQQLGFSVPIFVASTRLLVNKSAAIRELDDLRGKKIVTVTQGGNEAMLKHVLAQRGVTAQITLVRQPKQALDALQKNDADAFFADDAVFFAARRIDPQLDSFRLLEKTYSMRPKALAFRQGDEKLRQFMLKEMKTMLSASVLQNFYAKWFTEAQALQINLNTPVSYLLRESWKTPSDKYVDFSYGHLPD
jgi:ABC-type amino acid transport substrate-binding protein